MRERRAADAGLLESRSWFAWRSAGFVQYWDSPEALRAYAHDADFGHREGWQAYTDDTASSGAVGIWHETYVVDPDDYETVYNRMPASGLGAAEGTELVDRHRRGRLTDGTLSPAGPVSAGMDDRIREHARTLVDWSARIEAGDDVVVRVEEGAHDLAVAVAEQLGRRGANLLTVYDSDEVSRAYLRAHDGEFEADPDYALALYERADSVLALYGSHNTAGTADVPGDRRRAYATARQGIREARLDTDWVSTQHPTRAMAQQAGMAYEAYRDFVYDATLRDWEALAEEQARLKQLLDDGSEVHLVADGTDLTMSIADRVAVNSAASVAYDSHNLPSGEVFTAPEDTEGVVTFDVPMTVQGRRVRDVELTFEDGTVVEVTAAQGVDVVEEILDTDAGARRLGELGIGMNRGVDRITDNILFDEKMGGTVHLALGRAYDACFPAGESGTESAVHEDLITTMGEGSRLEVDGEVIQRDGIFRWEEGFAD